MIYCNAIQFLSSFSLQYTYFFLLSDTWLNPETPIDQALSLLRTYQGQLEWYPVSQKMNNTKYEAPDCIQKIEDGHYFGNSSRTPDNKKQGLISNYFQSPIKKDPSFSFPQVKKEEKVGFNILHIHIFL